MQKGSKEKLSRSLINKIAVIVLLCSAGCAMTPEAPVSMEGGGAPAGELRHEIVSALKARNESIQSLRGLMSVRYARKLSGIRGDTAIILKRPYDLRIDSLTEFGASHAQVLVSRGDLLIYWSDQNRFHRGLASREDLGKYLSVPLGAEEVISLMSGVIPVETEAEYVMRWDRKKNRLILKGMRGELTVSPETKDYLPLRYIAFDVDGGKDFQVDFADYQDFKKLRFPSTLTMHFRNPRLRIEIHYQDLELNPKLDAKVFKLDIPNDAISIQN